MLSLYTTKGLPSNVDVPFKPYNFARGHSSYFRMERVPVAAYIDGLVLAGPNSMP